MRESSTFRIGKDKKRLSFTAAAEQDDEGYERIYALWKTSCMESLKKFILCILLLRITLRK